MILLFENFQLVGNFPVPVWVQVSVSSVYHFHCVPDALSNQQGRYFHIYQQGNMAVPLRYNNDKQKKPLFSRGLSVCRLLFNSFSKLKIDENYKEKRRLFY
jgi:hypothetical protein